MRIAYRLTREEILLMQALSISAQYTDLPMRERLCVEKSGIWVAYFLYELFVTGPNAKETIAGVRWLLSLIPWWPLRQVSNPRPIPYNISCL